MSKKTLKELISSADKPFLGLANGYPAEGIIERIGADWDWVWVEGQHGQHDYRSLLASVRACNLVGVPAVVRVPGHDYGTIGLAMDMAPDGIMVPMINNVEEARKVIDAVKFPPLGIRSYGGRRPIDLFGRTYAHTANDDIFFIAQIETKEGLANAEAIAAMKGVDALFFSPDDVAMQDGVPMDVGRPFADVEPAMRTLIEAANKAGVLAGVPVTSIEQYKAAYKMGYKFFVATGDVGLLASGSKAAAKQFRELNADL